MSYICTSQQINNNFRKSISRREQKRKENDKMKQKVVELAARAAECEEV